MEPIRIQPIEKSLNIRFNGDKVALPSNVRENIDQYWEQSTRANPHLRNGEVFTVTSVEEDNDSMDIALAETDYAHYLYSLQIGKLGKYTVRIIHPATLVTTTDKKLIFGSMGDQTSRPGLIQCCGGGIDHDDITNGVINIEHNVAKELNEELGIDPYDEDMVETFSPAYIKSGGPTDKMTIVYLLGLKQNSNQFLETYQTFEQQLIDNGDTPEFGQLFSIDANRELVDEFIKQHEGMLNEYMPVLLRAYTDRAIDERS